MLSARENYLKAARGQRPERLPIFIKDTFNFDPPFLNFDPVTRIDWAGVSWLKDEIGDMPDVNHPVMSDVSQWREYAKFPILADQDWERYACEYEENCGDDKVRVGLVNKWGIFLIPINMMGWEEGLCAIYDDPEELEAFISALTDYFIDLVGYLAKYIKPDIYCTGDDIAAAGGPLVSKSVWDKLYKPYARKIIEAIHEQGGLAEFHCCGNCQYLIEELLDIGADILELPMPNEALENDKKRFGSRLVLTGGWDRLSPANKPGASEEVVRKSARVAIDTYGADGALLFWDGTIFNPNDDAQTQKLEWLYDEMERYGDEVYGCESGISA